MIYDEKKKAIRIISHYKDFDGGLDRWKDSLYTLWRYQMTWSFAYEISVRESRTNGVYVDLLVRPAYKDNILDVMDDLGYKDTKVYEENVAIVWHYEHEELEGIDNIFLD